MRGFMRAIGLGGLFRRSRTSSGHLRNSVVLRPIANPFIAVLEEKITSPKHASTTAQPVTIEPVRESHSSSIAERPQFLFFCGSESTGSASTSARPPSWSSARVNASIQQRQSEAHAPQPHISHRMPVFFAAYSAFPVESPTSAAGARPSASFFN